MPKPYSYDLRQKVIQAIMLDGLKISRSKPHIQHCRHTIRLWLNRATGNWETFKLYRIIRLVMDIKLLTGQNSRNLSD